jgi:hypothetical protein
VRASGDLVVGEVTVGRFVLKLPRSDEPVQRGTVSLHLEGFGAGSLKGTFEQRFGPLLRDSTGAPLPLDPAAEAASRGFFDALRPTLDSTLVRRILCATTTGLSEEFAETCRQLARTPFDFPHSLSSAIGSIPSHFELTPVEQSHFGCGPLWARDCVEEGINLFRADPETLLYFLPGGVGAGWLAREDEDDLDDGDDDDEDDDDERDDEEAVAAAARAFAKAVVALGSEDRFGPGPCDRETPEHCLEVRKLLDRVVTPLGGGVTPRRWLWEAGALFRVQSTLGDLLGHFRGGVVYASEPFLHSNGEVRVTLIPVPEPAAGAGLVAALAGALAMAAGVGAKDARHCSPPRREPRMEGTRREGR